MPFTTPTKVHKPIPARASGGSSSLQRALQAAAPPPPGYHRVVVDGVSSLQAAAKQQQQQQYSSPMTVTTASTRTVSPYGFVPIDIKKSHSMTTTTSPRKIVSSPRNVVVVSPLSVASNTSTTSSSGRGGGTPRLKTEMCMHYEAGRPCPFGADCTYAHGQEELQMTKLLDLHRAGLVDAHVYRTLPCFSLVSTGACPFGKRCTSLHPPELSNGSSWLPLTETQGNTISTDINVEALHQKRLAEITVGHDTPDLDLHRDDWNDWYRQVCNLQYTSSPSRRSLTPNIKLQIALLLRDNADWSYKFRPQHVVCNEQCMLLTEAAFFVTSHGHVQPLPLHSYRSSQPRHVHVRELAFGPDVDPSVRGVSLYFNLPLSAITVCTAQQAKRYRWKKRMPNWTTTTMTTTTTSSLLDGMDSFPMIRSHDVILFGLQTRALQHRLAVLQAENGLDLHRRHAATAQLRQVKQQLQRDWNAWKCSVQMWSWPPKRVVLDRKTPVPAVDGDYIPPETSVVASLWSTCRTAPWKESDDDGWNISHEHVFDEASPLVLMRKSPLPIRPSSTSPISILRQLSQGMSISPDRHLPHIHRKYLPPRPARPASYDACWKALLLQSSTNNNDWAIVHEHFSKSRSKKVLSIIQKG